MFNLFIVNWVRLKGVFFLLCAATGKKSIIFSVSNLQSYLHTSPCQQCQEGVCHQPEVCQGRRRSARTGTTASSETDASGSASGFSAESTGEKKMRIYISIRERGHTEIKVVEKALKSMWNVLLSRRLPFRPIATPSTDR